MFIILLPAETENFSCAIVHKLSTPIAVPGTPAVAVLFHQNTPGLY